MNNCVCYKCLGTNSILKNTFDSFKKINLCTYCDKRTLTIDFDQLCEAIKEAIEYEYDRPENGLGYDEGEFVDPGNNSLKEIDDLLREEFELDDGRFFDDIVSYFADTPLWCKKEFYADSPADEMKYSWDQFCNHVKTQSRFFFHYDLLDDNYGNQSYDASDTLKMIKSSIERLNLLQKIECGSVIYRAREFEKGKAFSVRDLGTPPPEKAKHSNRFSPAGIPAFYGSKKITTCLSELDKCGKFVIGKWVTRRTLNVVDITSAFSFKAGKHYYKHFPSLLDMERRGIRELALFFARFANDLSAPIIKDGHEHIDYVPTQIISEFLKKWDSEKIDGISYYSSKDGETNYVLFLNHADFHEKTTDRSLALEKMFRKTLKSK